MEKMGDHMKMNFDYIQIQKWMSRTVRVKKLDGKGEEFVKFSRFLPKVWSLNCQKLALYVRFFRKWNVFYANIFLTLIHSIISNTIYWKSARNKTFRMLYINSYNRPRFLAAVCIKLQKENNFWQFKDYSWKKSHANWTSDPIFFVHFFTVCEIILCIRK